jgi:hypothetical protein
MASDKLLTKKIGQEFACVGEWWVPSEHDPTNPKRMHTGTLTFTRGKGIVLDIMGQFESEVLAAAHCSLRMSQVRHLPVISTLQKEHCPAEKTRSRT